MRQCLLRHAHDFGELHLRQAHGLAALGDALAGAPLGGPTSDFNLMWRRERIDAQLWHRPLVGPMVLFVEPASVWVVHMAAGQARFADGSGLPDLQMGDTAILSGGDARGRFAMDGGGDVLLARLQRRG